MVSRKQKRVWRYVDEGNPLKLKSYLKKHPDTDVNFSMGKKQRSPLHLACRLGDGYLLRLLLDQGADVLRRDCKGDTAMHEAAKRHMKYKAGAYDDLFVPLRRRCQEAETTPNNAGVTPQDLLGFWRDMETPRFCRAPERNLEQEWQEKLFGECENEFYQTFGRYDDDDFLPVDDDDDDDDFGDWADRIRREYYNKKYAEAQRLAADSSKWKKQQEESYRELHARLQREHEEYLSRAARKQDETRQSKKQKYEEKCAATFHAGPSADGSPLSYGDIPWPTPTGTVQEMVDVMLHGVDRKDAAVFRKVLRKQQALWHPDKFAQRCGARLEEGDRQKILDTVTALSQELNRLAQSLRT